MHRPLLALVWIVIIAALQAVSAQEAAAPEPEPEEKKKAALPKQVEFELDTWEARLGLEDRQMRELRFAARAAAAKLKEVTAGEEDADENPWEEFKVKEGPWTEMRLPRALRAASFTKVADAVLTEKQIAGIAAFKEQNRSDKRAAMGVARAHAKLAALSKAFYLTPDQQASTLEMLLARAAKRQAQINRARKQDRGGVLPAVLPVRQDPAFLKILTDSQRKRLKKRDADGEDRDGPAPAPGAEDRL